MADAPSVLSAEKQFCHAQRRINSKSRLPSSLCTETHWKYNMGQHLQQRHPTWEVTVPEHTQALLSSAMAVFHDKERRLGVPVVPDAE
ncbi:hypothetical protein DFH07DRAFT_744134 [Mycena maculata]|uniref:Uncharacterized protein n=1 Tax=Mycena maculata TaxID=230809 RepID=A0AAD7IZP1_9AGAR|nr:hypothetical protein DFH07DRAFT_744134 [Mycena maculata]